MLLALQYIWSAPYGVLGYLLAQLLATCGWTKSVVFRQGVAVVECKGWPVRFMRTRRIQATTIGWVVFFWQVPTDYVIAHEKHHVRQVLKMGLLFPIVWVSQTLGWAAYGLVTRKCSWGNALMYGYWSNSLERAAKVAADKEYPNG